MKTRSRAPKVKKTKHLTLRDRLSRLNYLQACKLLGPEGDKLIQQGSKFDIDIQRDVYLRGDLYRVKFAGITGERAVASITKMAGATNRLKFNCTACETMCHHVGAAVSLVLEYKTGLGLAAVPDEKRPMELLSEQELVEFALRERQKRAKEEKFRVTSADSGKPWTDYTVASALSGKTYRVALRGEERGKSYCSCPDFKTNTLGTCKHVLHMLERVRRRFPATVRAKPYRNRETFVHVLYGEEMTLHLQLPDKPDEETVKLAGRLTAGPIEDARKLVEFLGQMDRLGHSVTVYPDAEELIQRQLFQDRMSNRMESIRTKSADHPLRTKLLKIPLLPYQLDGIAFAAGNGRAVLADDMGLGKTIQGVGAAEMLAREADISKVLVVCPASLKSQWRNEIHRFCDRDVQLVVGGASQRAAQYDNDCFFTVCNYEQVLRDILAIERSHAGT